MIDFSLLFPQSNRPLHVKRSDFKGLYGDLFSMITEVTTGTPLSYEASSFRKTETGFQVDVELPGVSLKDLEVLTVDSSGQVQVSATDRYGVKKTYNTLIPTGADPESLKADLADGILTLTLGKKAGEKPKNRKVTVSGK